MELEDSSLRTMDCFVGRCLFSCPKKGKGRRAGARRSQHLLKINSSLLRVLRIQGWDGRAAGSAHQAQLSRQAQPNAVVFLLVHKACYGCLPQSPKNKETTGVPFFYGVCVVIVKP